MLQEPLFAQALAQRSPRGRCLNAGSGEGLFSAFLESYAEIEQIVNVDIDDPQISPNRPDPRHVDHTASVTELPLEEASFDWVLCTEVIEHVEDDERAVREIVRVLKPGGFALISVPRPPAPYDPNHVREGYSLEEMTALLEQGGLRVAWHAYCFHLPMRWLLVLWRWQYERLGRGRRSLMPRLVVRAFAHLDRALHPGRAWDLIVLADKPAASAGS